MQWTVSYVHHMEMCRNQSNQSVHGKHSHVSKVQNLSSNNSLAWCDFIDWQVSNLSNNFIEAYLVKNTWTSRNQNSLKSSCFYQSFIRRLTDLPTPDLAYLLVRCWNLFTEVPGFFLFNKVTFHFRMIFQQKPWDWDCCREAVRKDKKSWDSRQNRGSWQQTA